jgi:hypothetical protein
MSYSYKNLFVTLLCFVSMYRFSGLTGLYLQCDGATPVCRACLRKSPEDCIYINPVAKKVISWVADEGIDVLLELLDVLKVAPEPIAYDMLRHWRTYGNASWALSADYDQQTDPINDSLTMNEFESELIIKNPSAYPRQTFLPAPSTINPLDTP